MSAAPTKKPAAEAKRSPSRRVTYQHGDLPAALARAVLELVEERGVKNISLAEAARRSGVSTGAPYRHFANREELLADIGAGVYRQLVAHLRQARMAAGDGRDQMAAVARAYVEFAVDNRPGVELLFQAGLVHADYPALAALDVAAYAEYRAAADATGLPPDAAHDLVFAAAAVAHGFAMLQVAATASYAISRETAAVKAGESVARTVTGFLAK